MVRLVAGQKASLGHLDSGEQGATRTKQLDLNLGAASFLIVVVSRSMRSRYFQVARTQHSRDYGKDVAFGHCTNALFRRLVKEPVAVVRTRDRLSFAGSIANDLEAVIKLSAWID